MLTLWSCQGPSMPLKKSQVVKTTPTSESQGLCATTRGMAHKSIFPYPCSSPGLRPLQLTVRAFLLSVSSLQEVSSTASEPRPLLVLSWLRPVGQQYATGYLSKPSLSAPSHGRVCRNMVQAHTHTLPCTYVGAYLHALYYIFHIVRT
jgi:hypothetical protein